MSEKRKNRTVKMTQSLLHPQGHYRKEGITSKEAVMTLHDMCFINAPKRGILPVCLGGALGRRGSEKNQIRHAGVRGARIGTAKAKLTNKGIHCI